MSVHTKLVAVFPFSHLVLVRMFVHIWIDSKYNNLAPAVSMLEPIGDEFVIVAFSNKLISSIHPLNDSRWLKR